MKHLLIVYHTKTSNTGRLAAAVHAGATDPTVSDVAVRQLTASVAGPADLLWADGLLLGTPENFGYMSGALKDFFDRTYYEVEGTLAPLPYSIFVSAGNDGSFERVQEFVAQERIARNRSARIGAGVPRGGVDVVDAFDDACGAFAQACLSGWRSPFCRSDLQIAISSRLGAISRSRSDLLAVRAGDRSLPGIPGASRSRPRAPRRAPVPDRGSVPVPLHPVRRARSPAPGPPGTGSRCRSCGSPEPRPRVLPHHPMPVRPDPTLRPGIGNPEPRAARGFHTNSDVDSHILDQARARGE